MRKITLTLAAISALGLLSACGEDSEKIQKGFQLQGEYQSEGNTGLSIQTKGVGCTVLVADVSTNKMVITETYIDKADCTGNEIGKVVTTTSMTIGDELTSAPGARAIDLKVRKVEAVPLDKSWLTVFGADLTKDCNVSDVPIGKSLDVTGKDCGVLGSFPNKDEIYFGSFQLRDKVLKLSNSPVLAKEHIGTSKNVAPRDKDLRLTLVKR